MSEAFNFENPESVHRGMLWRLKSKPEENISAAIAFLNGFKFSVFIDSDDANDPAHQICLLTIINSASRISLQKCSVQVFGVSDQKRNDNSGLPGTLKDAVKELGGTCDCLYDKKETLGISIGKAQASDCRFHIRAVFDGWRGGIVPYTKENPFPSGKSKIPLGATLAAGLAVYECFRSHNEEGSAIGYREKGMSLWKFSEKNWKVSDNSEPDKIDKILPIWFCGLGHLGQAYIWTLGHLPISGENKIEQKITLQDGDDISNSNLSTSVLTKQNTVGHPKVEICKEWLEERGFCDIVAEKNYISPNSKVEFGESQLICGLDKLNARRQVALRDPSLMIDGAIGAGPDDFQSITMTALPNEGIDPKKIWAENDKGPTIVPSQALNALAADGKIDECGLETLNNNAVGFSFVGVVASAIIISELLRRNLDGQCHKRVFVDMRSLNIRILD